MRDESIYIELTPEQLVELEPLFAKVRDAFSSGQLTAIAAQVCEGWLRAKFLDEPEARALAAALGGEKDREHPLARRKGEA